MVGNDPVRRLHRAIGVAFGEFRRFPDQGFERVGIIIIVDALKHRRNAFQPHACINGRARQIGPAAIGCLFKLHEHQIPDFDEAIPIFIGGTRQATRDMIAMVPENLAARAARPGIAHRPKIVAGRNANDPVFWQTRNFTPKVKSFIIGVVNCDRNPIGIEAPFLRGQVPSERNRLFLEIIPEGKIAEHFKKCVVPRGITDIVEVIMLAACPNTFLR